MEKKILIEPEKEEIIKRVLERFITKIRNQDILSTVYKYYVSDYAQLNERNRINIEFNFECVNLQIKRRILTEKNNYWNILPSELKVVEDFVAKEGGIEYFKEFVENLLQVDINLLRKKIKDEEKSKEDENNAAIKKILGECAQQFFEAVKRTLVDRRNFPYKGDVIKALLSLYLNNEQILYLMNRDEKLVVQPSYIEKYKKERAQGVLEGKIKTYPKEEIVRQILEM